MILEMIYTVFIGQALYKDIEITGFILNIFKAKIIIGAVFKWYSVAINTFTSWKL